MEDVIPKYEVLYNDLRKHFIGSYLISRDFKVFMSESGFFDHWKKIFNSVKADGIYISSSTDHDARDAEDTFGMHLNAITTNKNVEDIVTLIIENFISSSKRKKDFSDVIQSMIFSDFKDENISKVKEAFECHKKKEFPEKKVIERNVTASKKKPPGNKVFIVHGHNKEIKQSVARTISNLKLNPIILHEQSNEGLTIIEKFEKHSDVSFAIILLTFDDYGLPRNNESKNKRARQNVILELGYFLGKLGRNKILPLYEEGVELPNDISGVLYTKIDDSGNWKLRLVKELKSAGFEVDANDIL